MLSFTMEDLEKLYELNNGLEFESKKVKLREDEPKSFAEYVGQDNVKILLQNYIKLAKKENKALPHTLICSTVPGYGKTTLAKLIINKIGYNAFWVTGSGLDSNLQLKNLLKSVFKNKNSILVIDEIHRIKPAIAENLYLPMENFNFNISISGDNLKTNAFTLLGMTTQKGYLPQPLLDRFILQIELQEYTVKDLVKIIKNYIKKLNCRISNAILINIVARSFLIPRVAKSLTLNYINYIKGAGKKASIKTFNEFCQLIGINNIGLDRSAIKILQVLKENEKVGLHSLSKLTLIDKRSINEFYEPILLKLKLITYTRSGRCLTEKGLEILNNSNT